MFSGVSGFPAVPSIVQRSLLSTISAPRVLHAAKQEDVDLIVMGGTRRGMLGRIIWPEMAHEVVWNADVPVLIWY